MRVQRFFFSILAAMAVFGAAPARAALSSIDGTADVYFGLENPTQSQWQDWLVAMQTEREAQLVKAGFKSDIYLDPATAWSTSTFRQFHLFMYDESFYDRQHARYRTAELADAWAAHFGRIDSVLLWQGYPQMGFDLRNQFDFYHDMPGGVAKLRREVSDVLHARGVRVFVDYNPWEVAGDLDNPAHRASYQRLAQIVAALDADGVMLDTLTAVPASLKRAVDLARPGVVFSPERRPPDSDLSSSRQSWAQWYDLGGDRPSIYRQKWLVPGHQQFAIRRWDLSRSEDIGYSFFNGSGMLIWDNIFGTWNPYGTDDRRLLLETGAVIDSVGELFAQGEWTPLVPTHVAGLDANRWEENSASGRRVLLTLRNRTSGELQFQIPAELAPESGSGLFAFWPPSQGLVDRTVRVPAHGVQALLLDRTAAGLAAVAHFRRVVGGYLNRPADSKYDERTPTPWQIGANLKPAFGRESAMALVPGGSYTMVIEHKRRESGCYPFGADHGALWGWYYEDLITHKIPATVGAFHMRKTAVTNAEFLEFIWRSGYVPADQQNFLKQLRRDSLGVRGALPRTLPAAVGELPVTYVSLNDARAYAQWKHERLPSEAEWQWAAEGAGAGNRWPWGNDDARASNPAVVNTTGKISKAGSHIHGGTALGILGLTGNTWELTESEYTDGHTRFTLLRGGVYLPPGSSEWLTARGPRPNQFHAKYLLMSEGLDRSASISFRTVAD